MTINLAAAIKTGAVIFGIWGGMYAADAGLMPSNPVTNAIFGSHHSSNAKSAGLTMRYTGGLPIVEKVEAGSLADISGVKAGDKIKAINRLSVRNEKDFNDLLKDDPQGLHLIIERNGQTISDRRLGEKPLVKQPEAPTFTGVPPLGVNVTDMVGMYPPGVHAPMTLEPLPGSDIANAGIKAGEWILAINGKSISTAADYRRMTESDNGPLTFTVLNTEKSQRHQREVKIR